jgi:acetyl-CoA carboxylase biotin carboxylase subunit
MIAKILVHASDREAAIRKMHAVLDETVILGVNTNLDFQYRIMENAAFREGKADTGFIDQFLGK